MTDTNISPPPTAPVRKTSKPKVLKCVKCKTNEAKYKRRDIDKLCKYCWDRLEYPNLAEKTDEEIQQLYDTKYPPKKIAVINTGALDGSR